MASNTKRSATKVNGAESNKGSLLSKALTPEYGSWNDKVINFILFFGSSGLIFQIFEHNNVLVNNLGLSQTHCYVTLVKYFYFLKRLKFYRELYIYSFIEIILPLVPSHTTHKWHYLIWFKKNCQLQLSYHSESDYSAATVLVFKCLIFKESLYFFQFQCLLASLISDMISCLQCFVSLLLL